jgi:chitin synthase
LYSFWRFDDFSWGNTRVVLGDDGKKNAEADGDIDIEIPLVHWKL